MKKHISLLTILLSFLCISSNLMFGASDSFDHHYLEKRISIIQALRTRKLSTSDNPNNIRFPHCLTGEVIFDEPASTVGRIIRGTYEDAKLQGWKNEFQHTFKNQHYWFITDRQKYYEGRNHFENVISPDARHGALLSYMSDISEMHILDLLAGYDLILPGLSEKKRNTLWQNRCDLMKVVTECPYLCEPTKKNDKDLATALLNACKKPFYSIEPYSNNQIKNIVDEFYSLYQAVEDGEIYRHPLIYNSHRETYSEEDIRLHRDCRVCPSTKSLVIYGKE